MTCNLYKSTNCSQCVKLIKSLSMEIKGTDLMIVIPEMAFHNHERICLCLAQPIPSEITSDTKVTIQVGTGILAKMPVVTKYGNLLYADALKARRVYPLMAATDTSILILTDMSKIGGTEHKFPTVPAEFPPSA